MNKKKDNNNTHTLTVENLSVSVEGKRVVHGVSMTIQEGETHIIMGPNGSGKSTLLNALAGNPLFVVEEGAIILDGCDITKAESFERARAGIFFSMQYIPEIAGVTFAHFLHQSYSYIKKESPPLIDFYKTLKERVAKMGFNDGLLDRELNVGFSGGEKKQAEMIQLVALSPVFALLDEIDSGVDVDAVKKVFGSIKVVQKEAKTGVLLVTHQSALLDFITPDRVYLMADGKIVRSGASELASEISSRGFRALLGEGAE